jgi:hyperosmotically inducible protein
MSVIKNIGIASITALSICTFACVPIQLNAREAKSESVATAVSDTAITASIKAKYLADEQIKGLDIHVKTINGKVTLTGKVPSLDIEDHAISIAKNTDGVKEVISKLNTKEAKSASVAAAVSDTAITASIKAKYLADEQIKGLDIHVKTINGKVTLTGKVPSLDIEDHAISIAKNTDGVKEVISKLSIK